MLDFVRILILILVLLLTVWARMPGLGVLFSLFTLINAYMENKRTEKLKKKYTPEELRQLKIINFGLSDN